MHRKDRWIAALLNLSYHRVIINMMTMMIIIISYILYMFSANILLGTHFEAKISDFGLAKVASGRSAATGKFTNVTRDEMTDIYGSRAYLPHDFVTNGCKYSISTDVFSFGVVSLSHFSLNIVSL